MSLWQTWLLALRTERPDGPALLLGLWSAIWGFFLVTDVHQHIFGISPSAYVWTRPIPEWVWGGVWLVKGALQVWIMLGYRRARLWWSADMPVWLMRAYRVSYVNTAISFLMAWGFGRCLGFYNPWVAFYAGICAVQLWCLWRISGARSSH